MKARRGQSNVLHAGQQRGVALITALLILALCTTAAVFLTHQNELSIRRTGNIITGNQAYLYSLGGEALAMSVLNYDRKNTQFDALNEEWAMETVPLPVDGGFIQGKISDAQGRFNLNNLIRNGKVDPVWVGRFEKMLAYFGLEPGLASAVIDWMDPDQSASGPFGAEDDYYATMVPPYRAANVPMKSLSELRLIRGFSEIKDLGPLLKHLVVLPESTAINVNTASREVLISLGLDPVIAEQIARQTGAFVDPQLDAAMGATGTANANGTQNTGASRGASPPGAAAGNTGSARGDASRGDASTGTATDPMASIQPFESLEQFNQLAGTGHLEGFNPQGLDVSSSYFLFEGYAQVDRGRALLKSLLHRDNSGIMQVVMRSRGDL
jgi:general secretion pathway protein K